MSVIAAAGSSNDSSKTCIDANYKLQLSSSSGCGGGGSDCGCGGGGGRAAMSHISLSQICNFLGLISILWINELFATLELHLHIQTFFILYTLLFQSKYRPLYFT
jgi:hypothetical protein